MISIGKLVRDLMPGPVHRDVIDWYTSIAEAFDRRYRSAPSFLERHRLLTRVLASYGGPEKRALDVGCGTGVLSFAMAKAAQSVLAIDGSEEMIRICRQKQQADRAENVRFAHCQIAELPWRVAEQFDVILCSSVLEYVDDLDAVLASLRALLAPEGVLVLSLPNRTSLFRRIEPVAFKLIRRPRYYAFVKHVSTRAELEQRLARHRLGLVETAYFGAIPLLSRAMRAIGRPQYADSLLLAVARPTPPRDRR